MNNIKIRKLRLILYSFIYAFIVFLFYYTKYININQLTTIYLPVLGIGMIAIIIDYMLFGQILLVTTIASLIGEFILISKFGVEGVEFANNISNTIRIFGFVVGFIIEIYSKHKLKYKK